MGIYHVPGTVLHILHILIATLILITTLCKSELYPYIKGKEIKAWRKKSLYSVTQLNEWHCQNMNSDILASQSLFASSAKEFVSCGFWKVMEATILTVKLHLEMLHEKRSTWPNRFGKLLTCYIALLLSGCMSCGKVGGRGDR